jgi:hypothetical protein
MASDLGSAPYAQSLPPLVWAGLHDDSVGIIPVHVWPGFIDRGILCERTVINLAPITPALHLCTSCLLARRQVYKHIWCNFKALCSLCASGKPDVAPLPRIPLGEHWCVFGAILTAIFCPLLPPRAIWFPALLALYSPSRCLFSLGAIPLGFSIGLARLSISRRIGYRAHCLYPACILSIPPPFCWPSVGTPFCDRSSLTAPAAIDFTPP